MDFFSGMIKAMFGASVRRQKVRAEAKVRRATVGKVQEKMMKANAAVDRGVGKAQDRVLPGKKKPGKMGKKGGAPAVAGPAPVAGPGRAPVGPGTRPTPMQPQGAIPMGKGKQNKGQMPMGQMVGCTNCGAGLQADWDMCPYCGAPAGQAAQQQAYGPPQGYAPQPGFGPPSPVSSGHAEESENKTVAINIDELQQNKSRAVVGWIVAQSGNHRGEDFRLFDGKNLLGTAADCDIVITDPYLSAKHCTIRHEGGNFVLIDLDSTNGTFVNQKRVSKMELIDNDTVRLGRTEFKFKALF